MIISAGNEEELTQWIQALCLVAVESKVQLLVKLSSMHARFKNLTSSLQMVDSPTHSRKTYSFCAILLTKNKVTFLLILYDV